MANTMRNARRQLVTVRERVADRAFLRPNFSGPAREQLVKVYGAGRNKTRVYAPRNRPIRP